jgi:hypothetical protein
MTGSVEPRRRYRWLVGVVAASLLIGGGCVAFFARQSPLVLDGVEVDAATAVTADETGYTPSSTRRTARSSFGCI